MKTIFEHIEYAKGKPHHIRKRIAFAATALCSGLIALVWLIGSFSLGSFAIQGSNFADSAVGTGSGSTSGNVGTGTAGRPAAGVAGAAAAFPDTNAPAHIEIIDTTTSTYAKDTAEKTMIPF